MGAIRVRTPSVSESPTIATFVPIGAWAGGGGGANTVAGVEVPGSPPASDDGDPGGMVVGDGSGTTSDPRRGTPVARPASSPAAPNTATQATTARTVHTVVESLGRRTMIEKRYRADGPARWQDARPA